MIIEKKIFWNCETCVGGGPTARDHAAMGTHAPGAGNILYVNA